MAFSDVEAFREQALADWFQYVACSLQNKKGFEELASIDFGLSSKLRRSSGVPLSALGNFTSGAALTTGQKKHFLAVGDSLCKHCGAEDTQRHRLVECPGTQSARDQIDTVALKTLPCLQLEKMLFKQPLAIAEWHKYTQSLKLETFYEFFDRRVCLFTDGSTYNGAEIPRCTWSVVLADPEKLEAAIYEVGQLPGRQTNFRAELYAVAVAIQCAPGAWIFSDALGVVRGVKRLLAEGWSEAFWSKQKNLGLWRFLWARLQSKLHFEWQIVHVESHRDFRMQDTPFAAWTAYYNEQADEAAKAVQRDQTQPGFRLHLLAQQAYMRLHGTAKQVANLQSNLLQLSRGTHSKQLQSVPVVPERQLHVEVGAVIDIHWPVARMYNDTILSPPFLYKLHEFLQGQSWCVAISPISLAELYVIFVSETNWISPVNVGSWPLEQQPSKWRSAIPVAWLHETQHEPLLLHRPAFNKQVTIFLHSLKYIIKELNLPWSLVRGKHLSWCDCYKDVPGLSVFPLAFQKSARHLFLKTLGAATFEHFAKSRYDPPLKPVVYSQEITSPQQRWNAYYRRRRGARGR